MGKNQGGGSSRKGAVKERTQTFNEKTQLYIKRDVKTGHFMESKETPFKGVRREENAKNAKKNLSK